MIDGKGRSVGARVSVVQQNGELFVVIVPTRNDEPRGDRSTSTRVNHRDDANLEIRQRITTMFKRCARTMKRTLPTTAKDLADSALWISSHFDLATETP